MAISSNARDDEATTVGSQLRITTWPSGAAEVPAVQTFDVEQHHGAYGVWFELTASRSDDKPLPPDFYLREPYDVDIDDVDSLAAFVSDWGRFSDPRLRDVVAVDDDTLDLYAQQRGWLDLPDDGRSHHDTTLAMARRRLGEKLSIPPVERAFRLVNPVEVVHRVGMLRLFARHVDRWQSGQSPADLWTLDERQSAWVPFRDHLNAALSAFQVSIAVLGEPPSPVTQQVTAYSAAALQLWNDLETASYRHCDECGRLFTRQRGRSQDFSRSTGVRFDDRACANRYTQRQYRRRQKAKK